MTRPHFRQIGATLAACLVTLVATACGGSATTKQDVIARGDAICSSAVSSARAVVPPAKGTGSTGALAGYFKQLQPIVAHEVSQLRKLPRPDADKAVLNQYVDAVTTAGTTYRALVAAAERGDIAGVAKYLGELHTNRAQSLAQRYGMSQCAAAAATSNP